MSDTRVIDVYVDPETGKEYTADEIPTKYKDRLDEFVSESSLGQASIDAAQSGGYSFLANALGGTGQALGDYLSTFDDYSSADSLNPAPYFDIGRSIDSTVAGLGDSLSSKSKQFRDYYTELANQELGNIAIDTSTPQGYAANFLAKGIPGASKIAGYTLPAVLTRNPSLIAPLLTAGTVTEGFGADYGQGRDAGLEPQNAALLAGERAIPNYIQSKVMAPFDAMGGLKGVLGQTGGNVLAGGLDLINRSLTDQAIIEGQTPTLERTGSDLAQGAEQGLSEMILGQAATRVGARLSGGKVIKNQLNRDLEAELTDATQDPVLSQDLEAQLTPIEEATIKPDSPERVIPVEEKQINQLEDTSTTPKSLKDTPVEDAVTEVRRAEDVPVLNETDVVPIDENYGKENSILDDAFDPVETPKDTDAPAEKALNDKIDEVDNHYNNVMKVSEPLRPLVERQLIDSEKAAAVSEGIPESHPALAENAKMLQLDFIQRANLGEATIPEINRLANDTANISHALKTLQIEQSPVDFLNKLEVYRKELDAFDSKIGTDKPFKKSLNTNEYKKAIQDEVAHSIDPYSDPEFFKQLDQTEPNQIGKLVKQRIQQKQNGEIPSYGDTPASFIDTISNEKGAINLKGAFDAFDGILDRYKKNKAQLNSPKVLHDEMMDAIRKKVADTVGDVTEGVMIPKHKNAIEDFANGKIASLKGIIPDTILEPIEMAVKVSREYYTQPEKLVALDVPGGKLKKAYDTVHKKENEKVIRLFSHLETLKPYSDLIDKTLVNRILLLRHKKAQDAFQSGKRAWFSEEAYRKMGATDEDVAAIKAFDQVTNDSWKMVTYAMKNYVTKNMTDPAAVTSTIKAIDEWALAKQVTYYIPKTRKGKWAVYATHSQSDKIAPFYNRYESKREAFKFAEDLRKSGYNVKEPYEYKPPTDSAYALAPDEVVLDINNILKGDDEVKKGRTIEGFKSHFLKADLNIDGNPTDLFRGIVDYLHSASSMAAEWKYDSHIKGLLSESTKVAPEAGDQLAKWYEYTKMNTSEARVWRTMIAQHNLGFGQLSSAVLNGLSSWTSTIPELSKISKIPVVGAYHQMGKALTQYAQYKANPTKFRQENKKLYSLLEYAKRTGNLGSNVMAEYGVDTLSNSKMKKFADISMFLQGATEGLNRGGAIIAAYNNAPKGVNKVKFALDFNNKVNNDYTRLNKPKRARDDGGLVGTLKAGTYALKGYGHNYMSNLLEAVRGTASGTTGTVGSIVKGDTAGAKANAKKAYKNFETLAHYSLPIALAGGVRALPGAPQVLALANYFGYDLEKNAREAVENPSLSSMIVDGLPLQMFGWSISGAMAPTAGIEVDRDVFSTLGKGFIGPSYSLLEKGVRSVKAYDLQGPGRAIQEILPRGLARPLESYREYKDKRGFPDINGQSMSRFGALDLPNTTDLVSNALGFQPKFKVERRYEQNSQRIAYDNATKLTEGLGLRLANKVEQIAIRKGLQGKPWDTIIGQVATDPEYVQLLMSEYQKGVDPKKLESKALQKEAQTNYENLTNQTVRALRKAPKDLRPEIAKILKDNLEREKQLTRSNKK